MNWLRRQALRVHFFLCRKQAQSRHTPFRRFASMKENVRLQYCTVKIPDDSNALALARFTSYGNDDRALAVEQVIYEDDEEGFMQFECQVAAALECGIDVSVMSPYDLGYFPLLETLTA